MPNVEGQRLFLKLIGLDYLYTSKNMKVIVTADDAKNTDIVNINLLKPEGYTGEVYTKTL
jgi:hypothetical protein